MSEDTLKPVQASLSSLMAEIEKRATTEVVPNRNQETKRPSYFEKLLEPETGKNCKFPTLLTRIPLFVPTRGRKKLDTDWEQGMELETSWGKIIRFGPGLDIYDEDTLIGIIRTSSQKELRGKAESLPHPVKKFGGSLETTVRVGETSAYKINQYLGRATDGTNLKRCRASIKRLSLTNLIVYNIELSKEGKISLFDYVGDQDFRGSLTIQLSPAMTSLVETYTLIDMDIRKNLTDLGKALHKFLSGQPRQYAIRITKLRDVLYFTGTVGNFMANLKRDLAKLKELGWLNYEITGTGRREPFILRVTR